MVAAKPNRPDPKDEDRSFQFHMSEYTSLRGQVQNHMNAMRALERYVVGSVAALYSWILINHHAVGGEHAPGLHPSSFLWFLPLAVVVLGWLRSIALARRVKIVGEYCRQLETRYGEPDLGGWENILELRKPRSAWLSREILWRVLLVASLAFSTWGFVHHELREKEEHDSMDVKEAVKIALGYVADLFESEKLSKLGLEEVVFDELEKGWNP